MTVYELRLNGQTIELSFNLEELTKKYEEKKNANPYGYYEIFERK